MKIILLNLKSDYTGFPLGLAYISACLKKAGFKNVRGIDLGIDSEKLLEQEAQDADILGIAVMTRNYYDCLRIAERVKQINPKIKIIVGGPHPSVCPNDMMKPQIDFIAIGEGEYTTVEVAKELSKRRSNFSKIKGIWYKKDGKWIRNKDRGFLMKLDELPFPDRNLFDLNRYNFGMFNKLFKPQIPIIASRSCPYQCANCQPALRKIAGYYRKRSVKNVIGELGFLIKKYGYRKFIFNDNDISVDREWLKELCNTLIAKKMDIEWGSNVRANTMDEDIMRLMKKSGFNIFFMGVESGSQEVLDKILTKGILLEKVKEVVKTAKKVGIKPECSFMIGIPGETRKQMNQTLELATSLNTDIVFMCPVVPYPETRYEHILKEKNWLLSDCPFEYATGVGTKFKTDDWDSSYLEEVQKKCVKLFNKRGYIQIDKTAIGTMIFYNVRSNKRRFFILLGKEVLYLLRDRDIRLHGKNFVLVSKNLFLW